MSSLLNRIKLKADVVRVKLYYLFSVKLRIAARKKRILIVKNDSIGDYIIFRNFLAEIKGSDKFKNYELYLLTTPKLITIARELDGTLLKEVILSKTNYTSTTDQLQYYRSLNAYKFEYVLHPTYSPDTNTQHLIKFIAAKHKIGFNGDTSNQTPEHKQYFENYYTELISMPNAFTHEFEKNVVFFNAFLPQPLSITRPAITPAVVTPQNNIIICPGAQHKYRIWSLSHFGELITRLHQQFEHYSFVVVTGPGEDDLFTGIAAATAVKLTQFKIGSIVNLAELIAGSQLVVCNDSSAAHIAVACGVNSVCISNGNHYSRFIPYPAAMGVKQHVLLPQALLNDFKTNGNHNQYYAGSTLNINDITVSDVLNACLLYLPKAQA